MKSLFNLDNVIRLELRNKHNHKLATKKLQSISNVLEIDFDQLQMANDNYKSIWFIQDGTRMELICVVYDSGGIYKSSLSFFSKFENPSPEVLEAIFSMSPTEVVIKTKEVKEFQKQTPTHTVQKISTPVEVEGLLDMDTILDKINETGMSSLTSRELEFLKSLSK